MPALLDNRTARYRYQIMETWEVGIALTGQEVKSLRSGRGDIKHAYVLVRVAGRPGGQANEERRRPRLEAWLLNAHIPPYEKAGHLEGYDPRRRRQLLFRRHELSRLIGTSGESGLTLVPIRLYTHGRRLKLLVGLGRGKSKIDKRETIRRRELDREARRHM